MLNIPPIPRIHLTFHQSRGFTEHFTNPADLFNIPPIPRIHSTELIRRNNGNVYVLDIFHLSLLKTYKHYLHMSKN